MKLSSPEINQSCQTVSKMIVISYLAQIIMLMVVSGIFAQKILHFPTILFSSNVFIFFSLVKILKDAHY